MNPHAIKSALGGWWRSARARIAGAAIVLTYHRVADLSSDPQRMAISVEHFDEHMGLLSASYNTMGAGELLELMARRKRIPDRSVVVTIDDGYSDALLNAEPILSSRSVPATVFVSSDYVDGGTEFWWDELERIVLHAEALPEVLDIEAGGSHYFVRLDAAAAGTPDSTAWNITKPPKTQRQRIYLDLCDFVLRLSAADREIALHSLRDQLGAQALVRPSHRPLSVEDLRDLMDGGLIEIGAHTRSHQLLSARSESEQRDEIIGSKDALERITGRDVRSFAYPYGGGDGFSRISERLVQEAGFLGALTTRFGIVVPWMDRFAVPRCPTNNVSGDELLDRVKRWFEMAR